MPNNFFVTGIKGVGKSFLINTVLNHLLMEHSGFKTLPYFIEGNVKGHYFHSLLPLKEIENDLPFTVRHKENACLKLKEVFQVLGIPCLESSLQDDAKIIVMDEIGTIEANNTPFLNLIYTALDSPRVVLGTLKKAETHSHLNKIKSREDVFLLDLDEVPVDFAIKTIEAKIKETFK